MFMYIMAFMTVSTVVTDLYAVRHINAMAFTFRLTYTAIRALQESAALFSFMQANGIKTMQQLHDKISDMNSGYYDLRGKIVQAERRIATLTERGEMWAQYNKYKPTSPRAR